MTDQSFFHGQKLESRPIQLHRIEHNKEYCSS
jgi:hypothetical protein